MEIRTRIAPSPTGKLHLGTARTALFNFLFTRKNGGKFIFRIEDTDVERSKKSFETDMFEGLDWLGVNWNEPKNKEVYRQSERLDLYQKYFKELQKSGFVYECFCTPAELAQERKQMQQAGQIPQYSGHCKDLSEDEKTELRKTKKSAWRLDVKKIAQLKNLPQILKFKDLVHGEIKKNINEIGDFVIIKSDGASIFFFAGVVDDAEMKISHVIRGEDHISNTFSQLILFKALDLPVPQFAHIPLILEKDRSKMSKRKGGHSRIFDLRLAGYLPQGLLNFMALLGWSPKDDREFLSLSEIIESFDLKGIKKSASIFDDDKLNYLNGLWIRHLDDEELLNQFLGWVEWLKQHGEDYSRFSEADKEYLLKCIAICKTRMATLRDFLAADYLLVDPKVDPHLLVFRKSSPEATKNGLEKIKLALENYQGDWEVEPIFNLLSEIVEKKHLANGDVFWPMRVALSGKEGSPSPQELAWVLGQSETIKRIDQAISLL
ncbi:MAG: glutamate--tRNA ligase [Patescibacteria group bacterium]|nr:glutamate--tRNA ligase [Patescibacteria group bacterium]